MRHRCVLLRTRGEDHGQVSRLISPQGLGHMLKPFVLLELFDMDLRDQASQCSIHPHSGIATITVITDGDVRFDDPTGGAGHIGFGGFEWMRAGAGVWHGKELSAGMSQRVKGYQLWLALGREREHAAVDSQYVEAKNVPTAGPARVILGAYKGRSSPARSPAGVTLLLVSLPANAQWTFSPAAGQRVAWLAMASGGLVGPTHAQAGQLVVFEAGEQAVNLHAGPDEPAVFVVGSAIEHPFELHIGTHSVHTSRQSLAKGVANIKRLRKQLVAAGDRYSAAERLPVFGK
nr:pirin family protein [Pseudoduganella guangdongensis]